MSGHIIVQRRSGAAQGANLRSALVKKSHFEKMRIPFVRMFATHLARVSKEWVQSATDSESVGRQSHLRVMRSGKPCLKVASNVVI